MTWDELKDWKVVGAILTAIGGIFAWVRSRSKDGAEILKAKAEVRKIDRELRVSDNIEIDNLRKELNQVREELRFALITIDKLQRRLTVYETFKSSIKK